MFPVIDAPSDSPDLSAYTSFGPPTKRARTAKTGARTGEDYIRSHAFDAQQLVDDISNYNCGTTCKSAECKRSCTDLKWVMNVRKEIFGTADAPKSSKVRSQFVYDCLYNNKLVDVQGKITWCYFIGHTQMCKKGFLHATGINRQMIFRAAKRIQDTEHAFMSNAIPMGVLAGGSTRNREKDAGHAMAWLRGIGERLGQHLPNINETRLPFGKKSQVFEYYKAEMRLRGVNSIKYNRFLEKWSHDEVCSTIRCCKKKGAFAQCDDCANFATELARCSNNTEAGDVKARWNVHVERILKCRSIYYNNRDAAFAEPDKVLCLIADIMDQVKTTIPHWKRASKHWAGKWWLKQCLMGVKVHGHRMDHYIAHPRLGTGGGSNFTIECILRTLRKVQAENYAGGKLPPKLYMQMDNCSGDNKNYAILALCNFLVDQGVFEQVEVGYLPVGHTHEDIDQGFSVLSRHLKQVDAKSFSSFVREDRAAFNNPLEKPNVEVVNCKRDFKGWVEQPGILYGARVGILKVRYIRVLRYSRAKLLQGIEMKKKRKLERTAEKATLSHDIKELRRKLVELETAPQSGAEGSDTDYADRKMLLQSEMTAANVKLNLIVGREEDDEDDNDISAPVETTDPTLVEARNAMLADGRDPVVFHYKEQMDDPLYLPLHPEGVYYWLRMPEGEPEICPYVKAWKEGKVIQGTNTVEKKKKKEKVAAGNDGGSEVEEEGSEDASTEETDKEGGLEVEVGVEESKGDGERGGEVSSSEEETEEKGGGKKKKKKKKLKKDKSEFETVRDNVLLLLGDPVAGLTDEEKADWQLWILDQDKSPQDYVMETPWVFPSCTSFDDIVTEYSREPQTLNEVLTHEGWTKAQRSAEIRAVANQARIDADLKKAKAYKKIRKGDLVMFWEAVVDEAQLEEDLRDSYKGLARIELLTPLVMGESLEDISVKEPGHMFEVRRYRQPDGDMNKGFWPGVLTNNNVWKMSIDRDSVVMVNPTVLKPRQNNSKTKILNVACKRKLCEIPPVNTVFHMAGSKMCRIGET